MGIHDGHRERRRKQFLEHGLDSFADHEVLELLLFYAIGRRDTNPIAHELIRHFGSLEQVFSASVEELESVPGMGPHAATLIALIPAVLRRVRLSEEGPVRAFSSVEEMGAYFLDLFFAVQREAAYEACLDVKGKLICCRRLSEGGPSSTGLNVRRAVEVALRCNAVGVVIAHNHPSGVALPSQDDLAATEQLKEALTVVGVELLDHIIVADSDFVSMASSGMIMREKG